MILKVLKHETMANIGIQIDGVSQCTGCTGEDGRIFRPTLFYVLSCLCMIFYHIHKAIKKQLFAHNVHFSSHNSMISSDLCNTMNVVLLNVPSKFYLHSKYLNTMLSGRFVPIFYFNCENNLFVNIVKQKQIKVRGFSKFNENQIFFLANF